MRYDHIDVELHQLRCKIRKAVVAGLGPPIVDSDVPVLLISELAQARSQGINEASVLRVRKYAEKADLVDLRGLLRGRSERPRRRATEQRDELAAHSHSITSAASFA